MDLTRPEIGGLLRKITDLEERLQRLERGNPLAGSLPPGESIEVLDPADGSSLVKLGDLDTLGVGASFRDAAGTLVTAIGQLTTGSGAMVGSEPDGNATNTFFLATSAGLVYPWITHSWYKANDAVNITAGAFTTAFHCRVELVQGSQAMVNVIVNSDVGTTGEFRLRHTVSGTTTSTVTIPSGTQVDQAFRWELGSNMVVGTGPHVFQIEARRTGGAGNVYIFAPGSLSISAQLGGTATGI